LGEIPDSLLLDIATLNDVSGGLISRMIGAKLLATGAGPSLDFANAAEFFKSFEDAIETTRRKRLN
jgi:hypothetical protein